MAVLTVTADYDCRFWTDNTNYSKYDDLNGYIGAGGKGADYSRIALRFPLTDLPSNAQISQVRLYVYCKTAGSSTHLLDITHTGQTGRTTRRRTTPKQAGTGVQAETSTWTTRQT
jgi:hypothetical protein